MKFYIAALVISVATSHSVLAILIPGIPSFLKICHRTDPNINNCVRQSIDGLKPYLRNGIPALQIPACEPLHIPEIKINQDAGPVSISSSYTNISIYGGTTFAFKSVKVDLDKSRMRLKLYIPRLEMIANYNLSGKILMLPIMGNGLAFGNYTDIDVVTMFQVERYRNHDTREIHYRVTEFYMDFDIGHVNIHLDNLFNGDGTLADAMNLFLNDNWETVLAEMKPMLEENISNIFKDFSNKIFSKYPADALFPL